jgi:hypothetical protein
MQTEDWRDQYFGERISGSEASDAIADFQEIAEECVLRFAEVFGIALDFSEESLSNLEDLLSRMDSPPTQMSLMVSDLGCYLGEMLIRNLGGHWIVYRELFHSAVSFGEESDWYFPFHKVYKRISSGDEADSLEYFYRSVKRQCLRPLSDDFPRIKWIQR